MKQFLLGTLLFILSVNAKGQNITKFEYFIDTDPGFGLAIAASPTASPTVTDFNIPISITSLSNGFHTVYIRGQNTAGDWTQTHFRTFYIVTPLAPPPTTITQVEYFVDTDPGMGLATQVLSITPAATISNLAIDLTTTAYTPGFHTLYVRAKTAAGDWTQAHFRNFYITSLPTVGNLVKFEYFFDTDPGFDNGTPAPITPPALSVTNQDIFAVPSSLSIGTHTIYVRAKDSSGDWTQVSTGTFSVTGLPTITGFAPISGPIGITVTITGTNFDTTPANNTVAFNGTTSVVTASTDTSITTTVPVGATTGPISVTVGGNTATSGSSFIVTASPIPFTGLKLWLRADDLILPDNSPVSLWPDASGLGQDFSGTGATRPTFRTNGCPSLLNSRPYIQYSSQGLKRDDVIGLAPNTPRTIIAIYRMKSLSQREFVIEQGDFSTPGTYFGLDANSYGTHGNRFGVYATANSYDASLATDSSYHIHFLTANTMAAGTNVIGDVEYRIDNNLQVLTPDVLNGGNYTSFATANEMRVQGGNVDVAEVIVYNRPLSITERNDITTYLQGKYGSFPIAPPPPAPAITSFSPSSAGAGASITITGTNFDPVPTNNIVQFNGITAVVTASSATSITTTVPVGATTGPISVSSGGCTTGTSSTNFTVNVIIISVETQPNPIYSVCDGATPAISTTATGTTNITYQWQYSSDGIAPYTDLTNTGGYSNVSTSSFTINSTGNFGAGFYRCKINGDFAATVYSNTVSFTVNALPTTPITSDVNTCGVGSVVLTASGTINGNYLWYDTNGLIAGQNNSSYTTPVISSTSSYSVAITDGTCLSPKATITATILSIPAVPSTSNVSNCGATSFTLSAFGATNGNYLWFDTNGLISGQVNNTYVTPTISTSIIYLVAITKGSCTSAQVTITATINAVPSAPATQDETECPGSIFTLAASGGVNGQYVWNTMSSGGSAITGEVNSTYTTPALTTNTTYYVSINDGTCESARSAVTAIVKTSGCSSPVITATPLTTQVGGTITLDLVQLIATANNNLNVNSIVVILQPASGAVASVSNGVLTVNYNGITFSGSEQITVQACDTDGNCATQVFTITVAGDIVIYNGISPNGKNPSFIIDFIDLLPETKENSVHIFDRWENLVWHGNNYDNSSVVFTGISDGGSDLPSGVYYYKINFSSGRKTETGFLSLRRQ